jgi:hypothetical protein
VIGSINYSPSASTAGVENNIYIGNNNQPQSAGVSNEVIIGYAGTGKGTNTALIHASNGLFAYVPVIQNYIAYSTAVNVALWQTLNNSASRGSIQYNLTNGTFLFPFFGVFEVNLSGYYVNNGGSVLLMGHIGLSTDNGLTWTSIISQAVTNPYATGCNLTAQIDVSNNTTMTRISFEFDGGYTLPVIADGKLYLSIKYISL